MGGVELWMVEGRGSESERDAFTSLLGSLLSQDERARAEDLKFTHARSAFVVSRVGLRQVLGTTLNCAPQSLEFEAGTHGKPFLAGEHFGCGVEFNVSHSGDIVLYAVSRRRAVGVDVELKKRSLSVEKLARRYFAPGEVRRLLSEGSVVDRVDNFYRCWTRKEAYLKARGTGLTTKLDSFEVTLLPGVQPALLRTEVAGDDPAGWGVFDVPVSAGYAAAMVVAR
jgi:4'-phosphopantetheinyl transferase